jgi:hypothetical protein
MVAQAPLLVAEDEALVQDLLAGQSRTGTRSATGGFGCPLALRWTTQSRRSIVRPQLGQSIMSGT